jgi:hypothetical protein
MSFKVFEPALRFNLTNYAITPDEQDAYVTYTAANVSNDLAFYFLGTAGTAKVQPGTWLTTMPDYPRNAQFSITGTSVGAAGTAIINGKD